MPEKQLRAKLEELRAELETASRVDLAARERLEAVIREIEALLERSQEEREEEGLVDRLREAVADFEEAHPTLTEAAGRVIDALARMGI